MGVSAIDHLRVERAASLDELAALVGTDGPLVPHGSGSHQHVGGTIDPAVRRVGAPAGIITYDPAEMTVRCGAGTTVGELDAVLGASGQMCPIDASPDRTVGGALGLGRSGLRRLRYGPVRDLVLEVRFVSAFGLLTKTGGPTVKNVSGYDLARLLVGARGTLGMMGELVLRCLPRPSVSVWLGGPTDPFELRRRLFRPTTILWDGRTTWVNLEGSAAEVAAEAAVAGLPEVDGPPSIPTAGRRSLRPRELRDLDGTFLAEIGVGVVHLDHEVRDAGPPTEVGLHARVKQHLDPADRFAPGRTLWAST